MKRIIFLIICAIFLSCGHAWSGSDTIPVYQSSNYTADATCMTVTSGQTGLFYGLVIFTDGTNNVTIAGLYDNTAASGTRIIPSTVIIKGSDNYAAIGFGPNPVKITKGVTVDITIAGGGAANYMCYTRQGT